MILGDVERLELGSSDIIEEGVEDGFDDGLRDSEGELLN